MVIMNDLIILKFINKLHYEYFIIFNLIAAYHFGYSLNFNYGGPWCTGNCHWILTFQELNNSAN